MATKHGRVSSVKRVHNARPRYAGDLSGENEKLRAQVATLESERLRLDDKAQAIETVLKENDALRGHIRRLLAEKAQVEKRLLAVVEELARHPKVAE